MTRPRHAMILAAALVIAAVMSIGINRIVVTDGQATVPAFKSDYFPLN